eukprot:m.144920 g.144920  ORF g.144920 m.144920 type:complete len:276 (-) comp30402_c0_seq1:74-901(-)
MAFRGLINTTQKFAARGTFAHNAVRVLRHQQRSASIAANIKILRGETGLPINVLNKALKANDNDIDVARSYIQENEKERLKTLGAKMSTRVAGEGKLGVVVNGNVGAVVEIGCETDFVANTSDITSLYEKVAAIVLANNSGAALGVVDVDNIDTLSCKTAGTKISDLIAETIGQVGENVMVRRAALLDMSNTDALIGSYNYKGMYVGMVALENASSDDNKLAEQLAMHLVACDPGAEFPEGLETLLDSAFTNDPSKTVRDAVGTKTISGYLRWMK